MRMRMAVLRAARGWPARGRSSARIGLALCGLVLCGPAQCGLAQTKPSYEAQVLAANPDVSLSFGDAAGGFRDAVAGLTFSASSTGTLLYGQPSTLKGRTAASLTYDASLTAPNSSLGNFGWTDAWWAIVDVKVAVERAGSVRLELFSKGAPNPNFSLNDPVGAGYYAYLQWDGTLEQACLTMSSATAAGGPSGMTQCTQIDVPNGYGMTLAFTYDGSGTANGIGIYVNGLPAAAGGFSAGRPTAFSMATPGFPLYLNGDATNTIAGQGANVHNDAPTLVQAFAMGRGALNAETVASLAVFDSFYAQVLPPSPATPKTIIWDDDGCEDTDNLNSLAAAIRLAQLGYLRLALVNNTDWSDYGAAIFRQMLDQSGLHQVPVSSSQGTWTSAVLPGEDICVAPNLAAFDATYKTRAQTMSDVTGYRTALAGASDASVQIVVGGALRGVYDLMTSAPDGISPLSGAQLFAAKVTAVHMMAAVDQGSDVNLGEDVGDAAYVLAHAGVPMFFYGNGVSFGGTGPGADVTRMQPYPFVATMLHAGGVTRPSWDSWPVLGALDQALFWNVGAPGTVTLNGPSGGSVFSTAKDSQQYMVLSLPQWGDWYQHFAGSWLLNSLINANPEPLAP